MMSFRAAVSTRIQGSFPAHAAASQRTSAKPQHHRIACPPMNPRRSLIPTTTVVLALVVLGLSTFVRGATFALPGDGSTVVGHTRIVVASAPNTLLDIMRHFDVGYDEITTANPGVSVWAPGESRVVVPARFILPPKPWKGIVLNIPQRRLYYFPMARQGRPEEVITY